MKTTQDNFNNQIETSTYNSLNSSSRNKMGCAACRPPKPITEEQRLRINAIIDYYFEKDQDRNLPHSDAMFKKHFFADEAQDQEMIELFKTDYENYLAQEYTGWPLDRDGRLAAILLLDQYSRNMFRKQKQAFEADWMSQKIVNKIINDPEVYNQYATFEKFFFLLVLEHAESRSLGEKGLLLWTQMDRDVQEKTPEIYAQGAGKAIQLGIKYANDHYAVVARFGRYPHRNQVLGRESTAEEVEYLKDANTYGQ